MRVLIVCFGILLSALTTEARPIDANYTNDRFGYSISYRSDMFIAQPESDNRDGCRFVSMDNRATITTWGRYVMGSLDSEYLSAIKGKNITYQSVHPSWFALSGFRGSKIFYRKTLISKDGLSLHSFELEYDR